MSPKDAPTPPKVLTVPNARGKRPFLARPLSEFERQITGVAWFSNLGRNSPWDDGCVRIKSFDDWTGPEKGLNSLIGEQSQAHFDYIMELGGATRRGELEKLFHRVEEATREVAKQCVGYEKNEDAWHGPSQCVYDAAWDAGVIACCLMLGSRLPEDLEEKWAWFDTGHWPCGFEGTSRRGPLKLIVL